MAFRKRREARYTRLRDIGFLPFEARTISSVSRKTPYLSQMMATRASLLTKARKEGWSKVKYNTYIKEHYRALGWLLRDKTGGLVYRKGKTVNDPWQMWRAYEDRYKSKHPEYESPWVKKQQKWQRFTSKYDKGLEKYDKGRGR